MFEEGNEWMIEEAQKYVEWLEEHDKDVHILRYGYTLKQEAFSEQVLTDTADAVLERVKTDVASKKDPFSAVVKGVDDPWDVCLVRLFWTVIQNSAQANIRELHEHRMFEMQDGIPAGLREEIEKGFLAASKDASLIKSLGKLLQDHGLFDRYQDRFFSLVQGRG
jgi:hypothetical protein